MEKTIEAPLHDHVHQRIHLMPDPDDRLLIRISAPADNAISQVMALQTGRASTLYRFNTLSHSG
ncbi:hypothetical protein [Acrocarpospora sp. B8E8]|uniref:hypothetical protein n=1 Tax=Acrocarpospora sp. B8E8 TaxID=3153572 RepID=UPI00325FC3B2